MVQFSVLQVLSVMVGSLPRVTDKYDTECSTTWYHLRIFHRCCHSDPVTRYSLRKTVKELEESNHDNSVKYWLSVSQASALEMVDQNKVLKL